MHLLIIGDSFAADWSVKYADKKGWPNFLAEKYSVTNLAQAGCSEYKIKKQLDSVNLFDYTHCIVTHTSPSRIPVEKNPLHYGDALHHNCDFIYADIVKSDNVDVLCVKEYYEKFYDENFYNYVYELIVTDIVNTLNNARINSIHMSFFNHPLPCLNFEYYSIFKQSPGKINHLSEAGNKKVFESITNYLESNKNI
jgi:hypothetical protein